MIIKQVAVGNDDEAFVSELFGDGMNLIYSNDNNKGKTIILQSIVYALGDEPLFPKGFDYSKYKFFLQIEHEGQYLYICRIKDNFIISYKNELISFDGESGFKKWFDTNIFSLPKIIKNERLIVCDFELFTKLFYLGQDRRNTSTVPSNYFKKADFINMIYSIYGCSNVEIDDRYKKTIQKRKELIAEKKSILRKTALLKTYSNEASTVFDDADKEQLEKSLELVEAINAEISLLKRQRVRLFNRLSKNNNVLSEVNSIRKNIETGRFVCGECGSTNIKYYLNKEVTFDVSNDEMRKNIISNIKNTIEQIEHELAEVNAEIEIKQSQLKETIKDKAVNPVDLIILKPDIIDDLNYDDRLKEIRKSISDFDLRLKEYVVSIKANSEAQKELDGLLKDKITEIYRFLEEDNSEQIESLFTKGDELYSGSESTIFLISRLIAFQQVLRHNFPLIIDGYREGEVSSPAERRVINYLLEIPNQSIITATFKDEEYHKYDNMDCLLKYDLSNIESKHLLNARFVESFKFLLKRFSI